MQKVMQLQNLQNQRSQVLRLQMYITIAPCIECAKLIIQSEISRGVYGDFYRSYAGIELLKKQKYMLNTVQFRL